MGFWFLLVLVLEVSGAGGARVKFLPGFPAPLPFELETGYVGVGDSEQAQVFYYFVKSDGNPQTDPLILWRTGGPGCSSLSALLFGIGPISFKEVLYNGSLPQLILNPYSWTKQSSIIFVDLPMETGFSYGTTSEHLKSGDFNQINHSHQFLRKWLVEHPEFVSNPFYVGGDSYSGMIVPGIAQKILEGNRHIFPYINFQGYILGNPVTINGSNKNFAIPFAHSKTLISDELFESLKSSCKGEYVNIDPNNAECLRHYNTYQKCVSGVNKGCILWPNCPVPYPKRLDVSSTRRSLYNIPVVPGCDTYKYLLSYDWANDDQVRRALHIREGSVGEWFRCKSKDYQYDIRSVVPYHVNLSSKGYRSLIYSGDHDMMVPSMDTQAWIKSLNYSIVDDWRPWFIENQVAGYTRTYTNKMTFATIKGGGHTVGYKVKESSIMFSRWITGESL